jgi:hypothetical protein
VTTRTDRVLTVVSRTMAGWHVQLNRRSWGRLGNRFRGGQVLLLNHRGRRSGASANLDTYDGYQASVSRRIAVIRLSPVTNAA